MIMDKLYTEFAEQFKQLTQNKDLIVFEVSPLDAWAILSAIQIAIRHPKCNGEIAERAVEVARTIQEHIASEGVLKTVADMGWNPEHDQTDENTN